MIQEESRNDRPDAYREAAGRSIPPGAISELQAVEDAYRYRANEYYENLIDRSDSSDPIRRIVYPDKDELMNWGMLDPSDEASITVERGVQHKYPDTVLLLCSDACAAYCRYCFRKRIFRKDNDEVSLDVSRGIAYIREHPKVTDVLLSGGDPLMLSTRRLAIMLRDIRAIDHVRTIRIGSKTPAFNPRRILDDDDLLGAFEQYAKPDAPIHLMAHFDHPRELTDLAVACITRLLRNGVRCMNQCPVIRGVNDNSAVLAELFTLLARIGCPQYYVFQCRPTVGNLSYILPLVRSHALFEEASRGKSGLARTARFIVSHATGKIEIVGVDAKCIYARYHRAKNPDDECRFLRYRRNDDACWTDELESYD